MPSPASSTITLLALALVPAMAAAAQGRGAGENHPHMGGSSNFFPSDFFPSEKLPERKPASPPTPPAPLPSGVCEGEVVRVLIDCAADAARLGCMNDVRTRSEEIECLEMNVDHLTISCGLAMHELSKCLLTPHLFLPMEIASLMLLVTASVVLFCTLARCCCRHFCTPAPSPPSEITLDEAAELSDASDDEQQQTRTAGTSGGAAGATPVAPTPAARREDSRSNRDLDDDEELPAYQQLKN